MKSIPEEEWALLKKTLLETWSELTESELESTHRNPQEIINLLKFRLCLALEEASLKLSQIIENLRIFEAPHETSPLLPRSKKEAVKKNTPQKPANRDRKPKDDFHA